jgi:hypothetical protein
MEVACCLVSWFLIPWVFGGGLSPTACRRSVGQQPGTPDFSALLSREGLSHMQFVEAVRAIKKARWVVGDGQFQFQFHGAERA